MENYELKQLRQNIKDLRAEKQLKAQQERDAKRTLGEYFTGRAKILEQRGILKYVPSQTQGITMVVLIVRLLMLIYIIGCLHTLLG